MPDIPLSKVHANPKNPRRVITLEMIDNMAASLQAVGLKNPIKLNVLPDGSYELISGHIRFAGAQKLGWETIPAELLTLAPDQALLESILDNRGQPMNWLETAEAVESLMKARPKPSQEAVAKMVGIPQQEVSQKMKILSLLTPAARQSIYANGVKGSKNGLIPQNLVEVLLALGNEDDIEKAVEVAIKRKMTVSEAQKLVTHVKAGNTPKSYTRAGSKASASKKPAFPIQAVQSHIPHSPTSSPNTPTVSAPPEKEQTWGEVWAEMKSDWKKLNISGTEKEARENRYIAAFAIAIAISLMWLAWKAVVWVVTTVIHLL